MTFIYSGKIKSTARFNRCAIIVLSVVAFLTPLCIATFSINSVEWSTLMLVFVNYLVWLYPVWREMRKGPIDIFHPLIFTLILYAVPMIFVKGVLLAFGSISPILNKSDNASYYTDLALIFSAIGWAFTIAGFYLVPEAIIHHPVRFPSWLRNKSKLNLQRLILTLPIPFIINIIMMNYGAYGSNLIKVEENTTLISVLRPLDSWSLMFLFIISFCVYRFFFKSGWKIVLWCVLAILTIFAFISGSRSAFVWIVIVFFSGQYYAVYPNVRKKYYMQFIVVGLLAILIGTQIGSLFRQLRQINFSDSQITLTDTITIANETLYKSFTGNIEAEKNDTLIRLIDRFNSLDLFGLTLAPSNGLAPAERILGMDNNIFKSLLYGLIPRLLWPDKPNMSDFGIDFAQLYMDHSYYTSAGPSMFGDLFRNFGYIGIPIGMFIFGVCLRWVYWNLILRGINGPIGPLLYFFVLQRICVEGRYTDFFLGSIRVLFSILVLCILLYWTGALIFLRKKERA